MIVGVTQNIKAQFMFSLKYRPHLWAGLHTALLRSPSPGYRLLPMDCHGQRDVLERTLQVSRLRSLAKKTEFQVPDQVFCQRTAPEHVTATARGTLACYQHEGATYGSSDAVN